MTYLEIVWEAARVCLIGLLWIFVSYLDTYNVIRNDFLSF